MPTKSFGRRVNASPPRAVTQTVAAAPPQAVASAEIFESTELPDFLSLDRDSHRDEEEFRPSLKVPWRQLSLMASLCFGIASFVLPDSVNNAVDWLLYALMAASFFAWFSSRPKKPAR